MVRKESHKKYNWPSRQDFKSKSHLLILGVEPWLLELILITLLKQVSFLINSENLLWDYSSEIWYRCGDKSTDYNYYSKRILFNSAYAST